MASSLNPSAEEWRPKENSSSSPFSYLPHMMMYHNTQHINLQAPQPQPMVGFPAQAGTPPHRHHFYRDYCFPSPQTVGVSQYVPYVDQYTPLELTHPYSPCPGYLDGGHAAVQKAAPVVLERQRDLKKVVVPPRLRARWRSMELRGRETGKSSQKIWKPLKAKSDGASAVDGGDFSSPGSGNTTVMIKNIPNQYRRDSFMAFLDKYCLERHLEYDFLYLPMDFKTNNNVGYAFVNFTTAAGAAEIRKVLKNYQWGVLKAASGFFTSKKICDITWARIQGKNELVKHFQKSNFICGTHDYLPVVFSPPRNGSPDGAMPQPIGNLMGLDRIPRKA